MGASTGTHIEITEALVRLYVFLAQYLDRCVNEAARHAYPEAELQGHLAATRARLTELLAANRVVKGKVEQECERVLALGVACVKGGPDKAATLDSIKAERARLQHKMSTLSDLLAVFRAV